MTQWGAPVGTWNGDLCKDIGNNKWAFRGIPISARVYVIFADGAMGAYKGEIGAHQTGKIETKMRNREVEYKWREYETQIKPNNNNDELPKWIKPGAQIS